MQVDYVVPKITKKKIFKAGAMANQKMMKKEIKRLKKMGYKKEARKMDRKRIKAVEKAK